MEDTDSRIGGRVRDRQQRNGDPVSIRMGLRQLWWSNSHES